MPEIEEQVYKVLVVGGSYAGLAATLNLIDLCHGRKCRFNLDPSAVAPQRKIPVQVTIVDERDGYYHLIGVPLALGSNQDASNFWKKYEDIPALQSPDIKIIQGSVESVDCKSRVARINQTTASDGHRILEENYDYMIATTGLRREWPSAPKSLSREAYLAEMADSVETIENAAQGVVVVGGGAVGIEIAAELKMLRPQSTVTLIHSRQALLSSEPLPEEFSAKALELLKESNVELILGTRVQETIPANGPTPPKYKLRLSNGEEIHADHVINAVSKFTPTSSYLPKEACNSEGYIRITPGLEFAGDVSNREYHYAAGDIACWSGVKRGGAAMHQGHFAVVNIHQKMMAEKYKSEPTFVELAEVKPMMALALGATAVGYFPMTGISSGDEVRNMFFNEDLGYQICWKWMRLGEATA
ncbi:uncharacterized protein N7511_004682 [Penicillium nucicola]|uniref:uncharacterized protein n=1 Tax=Penicillium nucicola TaxID=1850975 RepID=UPI0025459BC9|nr:uncharacterized protein N7511_004682 [Penicillium nucicola]KAJ5767066.1 hypothetical protein N7511_004682 [Penicillium nucicola]